MIQAIFDPSQGFFNALLFVLASKSDRNNIMKLVYKAVHHMKLCLCSIYRQRSEYESLRRINDGDNSDSNGFYSAAIDDSSNQRNNSRDYIKEAVADENETGTDRLLSNCSTAIGHPSLLGSASDYDCDSTDRMSEFSFDASHKDKQINRR